MLINLSNHPSANWSESQLKATTEQYGAVIDLPFPAIAPDADIDSVLALAEEYRDKCIEIFVANNCDFKADCNAVHVMGEMTFTYNVVRYLSHKGIDIVASTTERIAETDSQGQKTSVFKFKQFRSYHSINEIPY